MAVFIIEGTDGVGKTTLAKRMAQQNPRAVYLHASAPRSDSWVREYVEPILEAKRRNLDLILDRWHLGEMVWPAIFGRESLFMSPREFNLCNELLASLATPVHVHIVDRDPEDIQMTILKRGEGQAAADTALRARAAFLRLVPIVNRHLFTTVVQSDDVHSFTQVEVNRAPALV